MTEESKDGCGTSLAKLSVLIGGVTFRCWVMTKLWLWFVVPLGVLPVGFWHVCGLFAVLGLLKSDIEKSAATDVTWGALVGRYVLHPTVALGVGWLYLRLAF